MDSLFIQPASPGRERVHAAPCPAIGACTARQVGRSDEPGQPAWNGRPQRSVSDPRRSRQNVDFGLPPIGKKYLRKCAKLNSLNKARCVRCFLEWRVTGDKNSYPGWEELGSPRSPFRNSIHPRNGNTPLLPTAKLGPDDTRASSKWVYPLRIEEALSTRKTLSSDSSSGKEMRRQHRATAQLFRRRRGNWRYRC